MKRKLTRPEPIHLDLSSLFLLFFTLLSFSFFSYEELSHTRSDVTCAIKVFTARRKVFAVIFYPHFPSLSVLHLIFLETYYLAQDSPPEQRSPLTLEVKVLEVVKICWHICVPVTTSVRRSLRMPLATGTSKKPNE